MNFELTPPLFPSSAAAGQLFTEPANEHPNPYLTVNDYFKMPPGRTWGGGD